MLTSSSQADHESAAATLPGLDARGLGGPVPPGAQGLRVDAYLGRAFPFLSRAGWQTRVADGRLRVNGRHVKASTRLKAGDRLTLMAPPSVEPEVDRGIQALWTEGAVMAVYKPGNLPMHENGPYRQNTFTALVWERFGREWCAVHRLDRETSGIVLCAATPTARGQLAGDLAARRVHKEYLAIANGAPTQQDWVADGPIGDLRSSVIRIKKWVVPGGLEARTEFHRLAATDQHCLLRARPRTGRTNQIRIHAAHAGHYLVGDKLFHPDENVFLDHFEHGLTPDITERTGHHRLCLHAAALGFIHPETRRACQVESPLPEDMRRLWQELGGALPGG